jgi:co-chaperonin GroES (HSP10)
LTPESDFGRALLEMQEGPRECLEATLLEEPEELGLAVRRVNGVEVQAKPGALARQESKRDQLVWYGMHPEYYGAMAGDRLLIRKDILENEYSCKVCKGMGYQETVDCHMCRGEQKEPDGTPCKSCRVLGYGRESMWSSGKKKCEDCRGSGWKRAIVIPEEAQQEAITGVVVSVGPDCKLYRLGDRVIHSKFAGHELKVSKLERFVMIREPEVLGILRQR